MKFTRVPTVPRTTGVNRFRDKFIPGNAQVYNTPTGITDRQHPEKGPINWMFR